MGSQPVIATHSKCVVIVQEIIVLGKIEKCMKGGVPLTSCFAGNYVIQLYHTANIIP